MACMIFWIGIIPSIVLTLGFLLICFVNLVVSCVIRVYKSIFREIIKIILDATLFLFALNTTISEMVNSSEFLGIAFIILFFLIQIGVVILIVIDAILSIIKLIKTHQGKVDKTQNDPEKAENGSKRAESRQSNYELESPKEVNRQYNAQNQPSTDQMLRKNKIDAGFDNTQMETHNNMLNEEKGNSIYEQEAVGDDDQVEDHQESAE